MARVVLPQVTTEIVAVDTIIDTTSPIEQRVPLVVITGDRGPHNKVVPISNKNQFYRYFGKPNMPVTGPGHYIVDNVLESQTNRVYAIRASVVNSDIESNNDHIANATICNSSGEGIITGISTKFNFLYGSNFVYIDYESLVGLQLDNLLQNVNDVYSPITITQNIDGNIVPATLNVTGNMDIDTGAIYTGEYPYYLYSTTNNQKYKITKIQKFLANISPNRNKYATNEGNAYYQLTIKTVDNDPWAGASTIDLTTNISSRLSIFTCKKIPLGVDGKIPSNYTIGSFASNSSSNADGLKSDDIADDSFTSLNYCFVFQNEDKITTAWESGNLFLQDKFEIKHNVHPSDITSTTKFFFKQGHQYAYVIQTESNFSNTTQTTSQSRISGILNLIEKMNALKGQWLYPTIVDNLAVPYYNPLSARHVIDVKNYYIGDNNTETEDVFKSLGDWALNPTTIDRLGFTVTTSIPQSGLFPDFIRIKTKNYDIKTGSKGQISTDYGDGATHTAGENGYLIVKLDNLSNIIDAAITDKTVVFVSKIKLDSVVNIPENLYTDVTVNNNVNIANIDTSSINISKDETDDILPLVYFKSSCYNYDPYEVITQFNISKHKRIKRNQPNNILTFSAIGTGKYYNNLFITATRNTVLERYFVDQTASSIYPYNFIDLKIWEQTIDSDKKLLESTTCSLLPSDNEGNPFKHPITGKNFFIGNVLNSSYFVKCFVGSNINYLKSTDARAKLLSYLEPNLSGSTNLSVNSFNSTYGGILLSGGEDGCMFDIGTKTINLKHPELTKTLISIFDGTCYDESTTIDKLDEYINPVYRINYIVTGGYDYTVNIAAMNLADKRQDCLCLSDVGTTTFAGSTSGAGQDRVFVQSLYAGIDTPHAAMYTQARSHNDVEFTNHSIILPSTYYALWHNMDIDNNYFISEPVAGNPKTAHSDAPTYNVKNEQQQALLDARCNPTIREKGNSYLLDELTMRKKYDGLAYIHCIKFIHKVKVDVADLLRPYLKRKLLNKYKSEMQSVVNSYLSQFSNETLSEKLYSLTSFSVSLSVDDASSIINVNLSLSVVKGINAIAITLNVQ